MDKRESLKLIAKALLQKGNEKNVVESREIDLITFQITKKLDKNIQYEFRNFLFTFGLISPYANPAIKSNKAFVIEKKTIKEFLENAE